ncbi:MAG: YihY/virulence factor BrkB family protein [Deltaproteobacteria bacterium]|nr:YihY/virulence factor BrkB family protein [Deltaproteobacteria bacterium]
MVKYIPTLRHFFSHTIWLPESLESRWHWVFALVQIPVLAFHGLIRRKSLIRISALAYSTVLALIPLLARLLAAQLLPRLAGGSQEFARQILNYIEATKVTSLGIFGVIWLLVALVLVMTNVEQAFNEVWGVPHTRPWWRKLSDYLSIFLLLPLLMAVSLSIATAIRGHPAIRGFFQTVLPGIFDSASSYLISFGLIWLAFTFIYLVMPNTRVRFLSALLGGIVGGSLWQVAQWIFLWFQATATYYNAIYGALYQLLFLIIWIFWSWLVILFGSEVAFAHQHLPQLVKEFRRPHQEGQNVDEYLGLAALMAIGKRFYREQEPLTLNELTELFSLEPNSALELVKALQLSGLVVELATSDGQGLATYLPQRPLDRVSTLEVINGLRQRRWAALSPSLSMKNSPVLWLERLIEGKQKTNLEKLSVKDLIDQETGGTPLSATNSGKD